MREEVATNWGSLKGNLPSVIYAYEQALLALGYHPDIWYEAILFQQQAAQMLGEKGDVKQKASMLSDVIRKHEQLYPCP